MLSRNYLNEDQILNLLGNIEEGFKEPSNEFFKECSKYIAPFKKLGVITLIDENDLHSKHSVACNIPGCNQLFNTVFEYETHYNSLHRYLCCNCKKNLPSAHLLDLHVSENHDSFFAVQAERKPMYLCFLPECSHRSINSEERKDHCIREHKFPNNFRFDKSNTKEKTKQSNKELQSKMDLAENNDVDISMDEKSTKHDLNFFSFGHNRVKVFGSSKNEQSRKEKKTSKNSEEITPLDNDKMVTDLLESLPNQ